MRDGIADCELRICVLPAQSGPEEKKRYQWRILVLSGFGDFLHSRPLKGLSREQRDSFFILKFFFFSSGMGKLGKLGADAGNWRFAKKAKRRWRFLAFGFFVFWFEGGNCMCIVQVPWLSALQTMTLRSYASNASYRTA